MLRAWKGAHADTILVVATGHDGGDCGVDTPLGTTWLVYGDDFDGRLFLLLCSRSAPSSAAAGDIGALGAPLETGDLKPGSLASSGACAVAGAKAERRPACWYR